MEEKRQLQIGICDDEENIRSDIKEMIAGQEGDCRIIEFSDGRELLGWLKGPDTLDLLFLDISMEEVNGMEAARALRERMREQEEPVWGSLPLLIFVTGYAEYMPDAFGVQAFQYLLKPVKEKEFRQIFQQAVREVRRLKKKRPEGPRELVLKYGSTVRRVPVDEICYLEGNNRKVIVSLCHEKIAYYARLGDLEQELGPAFFRIHRGYLVHLKYVERYDRKQVILRNQDSLLLSRYKYQEFVHAYMNYLAGETL